MKFNPWYLLPLVPLCFLAASSAIGAQLAVIGITLGIFFGTVSLRSPPAGDATSTHPGH